MKRLLLIRLAILSTFKKKLRVFLAISGIAFTSAVMIVLLGLQIGLRGLVDNEISKTESKDIVTVNQRNLQQIKLNDTMVSKIQSISGVSSIDRSVGLLGTAVYHDIVLNAALYAVTDGYFSVSPTKILGGTIENQPVNENVIVSSKVLDVFGLKTNEAVGKKIQLSAMFSSDYASKLDDDSSLTTESKAYKIAAVIDRGELPVLFMPIEDLRQLGLDSVAQLKVRLTLPDKATVVRESIEQMGFQTTSIQDTIGQINKLFIVINNALVVFGAVVFLITVSGTFTIISLTLMEETRQIGFLRIMGLRHGDVSKLFIIQSIIVTSLGSIFGVIIGTIAGFMLNGYARAMASAASFSGDISIFVMPVQSIAIMLMLAVGIGWLVGIMPAKRAVLINPLEELKL